MATGHGERTKSGMVRTFVTPQPIVCGRCHAPATHGAARVDSRSACPGEDHPVCQAFLFCAAHATSDYYRWPPLARVTPTGNSGRSQVTVGELTPDR